MNVTAENCYTKKLDFQQLPFNLKIPQISSPELTRIALPLT